MLRHSLAVIALALLLSSPALTQQPTLVVENEWVITDGGPAVAQDWPQAVPSDVASPSAVVEALVEAVSSKAGERPNWDRYRSLFLPGARLVPTGRDSAGEPFHGVRTVEEVVKSPDIERRTEGHFIERLIHTEIDRFGDIAHVLYAFKVFESADHDEPSARGIGSLQLWYDGDRW